MPSATAATAGEWQLTLELHADALRLSDPVPMLVSQLQSIPGLAEHCPVLYTVLSELYSNALEHGVLRLNAAHKGSPEGLQRFLDERERKLALLDEGWVRLAVVCTQWIGGGQIVARAEDSGPGFNWTALASSASDEPSCSGMRLLRGLCANVGFEGKGNRIFAVYAWGMARAAND